MKCERKQSVMETLKNSPRAGSLVSSSFVEMLDRFRHSFVDEMSDENGTVGSTTVSSFTQRTTFMLNIDVM